MHHCVLRASQIVALAACLALLPVAASAAPQPIEYKVYSSHVEFFPQTDYFTAELNIGGVQCQAVKTTFERGERIVFLPEDERGKPLPDGIYSFDLTLRPEKFERPEPYAGGGDPNLCRGIEDLPPLSVLTLTGYVTLYKGKFADPNMEEDGSFQSTATSNGVQSMSAPALASSNGGFDAQEPIPMSAADQVILDDLIVDGSACIGFDCVNGESFGFDTIRLKENNLRIKFDDTSVAASFPRTDWQLTANASANGGASKFSIDDISGGRTPFTVEANARSHSLYVDDGGRLGIRTSTPSTEIHVIDGDTPTLRLQQDGSSGFAPQTWDVAGNETNFFVRDVTNGSTLPFRIRPGAPTSSIFVDVDGDVGMGTTSPDAALHVDGGDEVMNLLRSNAVTTRFTVINTNDTSCPAGSDCGWSAGMRQNSSFIITREGSGMDECTLDTSGNFSCIGTVSGSSSRTVKSDIVTVDPRQMLARVLSLPITEWTYTREADDGVRHVSPIAEDFYGAFGLGHDEKFLAPADVAGVALAAIQGLGEELEDKDAELAELRAENERKALALEELTQRLERLEALLP